MKKKYVLLPVLLLALALVLSACLAQEKDEPQSASDTEMNSKNSADVLNDHMGCQEEEVTVDGTCRIAENNNASLFDKDLNDQVAGNNIEVGDVTGYIAKPLTPGDYPGVVMIHEWWGLNDNIKEMARILANEGYVVFAIDLYGAEAASTSERARELATQVRNNPDQAISDMQIAVNYLLEEQNVTRIASMGWCFGGQQSLQLSLNETLDATVIYYGQLTDDPKELEKLKGPVLGIFGSEDSSIPVENVVNFESALNSIDIENDIHIYDGVGHAFANPSGTNYAPKETRDAWAKTISFLEENLK